MKNIKIAVDNTALTARGAFQKLESLLCDLDYMAEIADDVIWDWYDHQHDKRRADLGMFAVGRVKEMCAAVKSEYYRLYELSVQK